MLKNVILILVVVCCVTAAIDTLDTRACARDNEYCLNHWDCCSNTCLNYLYKCSSIQGPQALSGGVPQSAPAVFASAPFPTIGPASASLSDLIQIVFRPLESLPQVGREINSIDSRIGEDEPEVETQTELQTEPQEEEISLRARKPTTERPQCKEIGAKCYFNVDCCTKRCHGYLHQCVT